MSTPNDSLIQERLSLERTVMSNQRTLLSFLRTSMYFLVAGLSIRSILGMKDDLIIHILLYAISGILFITGIILYFQFRNKCRAMRIHLGEMNGDSAKLLRPIDVDD